MTKNIVEINNLELGYYQDKSVKKVVGPLSFGIAESEMFALVGESGSGKSTIALEIMDILRFKQGKRISGSVSLNLDRKDIAYIPQDPKASLDPLFTIGDQMKELGVKKADLENVLEKVKLPLKNISLKSYPHELSGGMLQRLLIGMAFLKRPKLIIADEPTSSLDVINQSEIMKLFSSLRSVGVSILYITHNIPLAMDLCSKIAILYKGNIVETGNSEDIYLKPTCEFTKKLLNAVPVIEK